MTANGTGPCSGITSDGVIYCFRVRSELVGMRLSNVVLRLSLPELIDPRVREWITCTIAARSVRDFVEAPAFTIEVYP